MIRMPPRGMIAASDGSFLPLAARWPHCHPRDSGMTAYTEELVNSLTTLNRIAETLNRSVDVAGALNSALADLVELMGLETGWVFLREPAAKSQWFGRGFTLAAECNLPPAMARHKASAWKGGCDCQAFCNKGTLTGAYNEVRCTRLAEVKGEDRGGLVVHASAPLRSGERVLGILNVAAPDWESFTPETLALLSNAGSLMGIWGSPVVWKPALRRGGRPCQGRRRPSPPHRPRPPTGARRRCAPRR